MTTLTGTQPPSDPLDWIDSPAGLPGSPTAIRIDDFIRDDHYVLQADLPGLDPDRDIDVEIRDDMLTVRAQRVEKRAAKRHREIRYGEFSRTVRLPAGCQPAAISARYDAGVLEITVPVSDTPLARKVHVTSTTEEET